MYRSFVLTNFLIFKKNYSINQKRDFLGTYVLLIGGNEVLKNVIYSYPIEYV